MIEQRQATVKQVQFLEMLEQKTGDKFQGVRWLASDVKEYLDTHAKKKNENGENNNNTFKASNPYSENQQKPSKITDKQKQYIKVLEDKTGVFFNGKTFEDAEKYIKEHRS